MQKHQDQDYNNEWIGKIPEDWKVIRLKFAAKTNPSKPKIINLPDKFQVSFLPMELIGENGHLKLNEIREIWEIKDGLTYFQDGDILVAKITPCFENGKGALCKGLKNGIGYGTTELYVIRTNKDFSREFLYYWTRSDYFHQVGESMMFGSAGQKRIPLEFIMNFKIAYPPSLQEQSDIAGFLGIRTSQIEQLVEKKNRLIELLKEKRQATINQAVTKGLDLSMPMKESGIERIGNIPEHWEIKKLKFTTIHKAEKSPKNSNLPYVGLENIEPKTGKLILFNNKMEESDAKIFLKEDVLFGKLRPYLAKILFCDFEGRCSGEFLVLKGKEYVPRFLQYLLLSDGFIKTVSSAMYGVKMPRVEWEFIGNMKMPIPPINSQKKIFQFLDSETYKIDLLIKKIESQIEKLEEFRQSLILSAVTGKLI